MRSRGQSGVQNILPGFCFSTLLHFSLIYVAFHLYYFSPSFIFRVLFISLFVCRSSCSFSQYSTSFFRVSTTFLSQLSSFAYFFFLFSLSFVTLISHPPHPTSSSFFQPFSLLYHLLSFPNIILFISLQHRFFSFLFSLFFSFLLLLILPSLALLHLSTQPLRY